MMNKKTKASAAILASLLAVSMFAGCTATEGGSSSTASTASTAASDTESKAESGESADLGDKVFNVGVCQLVQHEALDAATQGFKDEIVEELGEEASGYAGTLKVVEIPDELANGNYMIDEYDGIETLHAKVEEY